MSRDIRQAGGNKSTRPSTPQSQTPRSRRLAPGQSVTILFFNPTTDKVVFRFRMEWDLFARTRRAARQAGCTVGEFIQAAFLTKFAALEKELASGPHSVRKGGRR